MPYITVNGIDLYYVDSGSSSNPLLFLHGWGTSGRVWDQQAAYFAGQNRVLQLDWRGCGRSDALHEGNTIQQIASDINEVLEELDLYNVTIIGTSMGGSFAIEVAHKWPKRLSQVITVDSPYHVGRIADELEINLMISSLLTNRVPTLIDMVASWYSGSGEEAYRTWAESQVLESSPHIANLYADHLRYDPRPYLPEITVPIALIHGAEDTDVPPAISAEISEILGGAPLYIIENAGHFPHHTSAKRFNEVLKMILENQEDHL